MNSVSRSFSYAWRPVLTIVTLALISYLLYFHQLGSLLPGYAPAESTSYHASTSLQQITRNPINAPYKLLVWTMASTGQHTLLADRIVAAVCSLAAVVVFFCLTRAWYGFRIAFFATVLFATSSGFLHVARLGTPQILQMGILMLLGIATWHRRSPHLHPWLTYALIGTFGLLLYVPGMVWLELFVVIAMHQGILRHWDRATGLHRSLWIAAALVLAAPLLIHVVPHPDQLRSLLGLPSNIHSLIHFPRQLLDTILAVGVRSNGSALLWVGHSPLLNVVELVLGALGVYYYIYLERSLRSVLLSGLGAISIVLASLGGGISIACLVPLIYLLVGGGLSHFLGEWLTVFPRNPIAKGTGLVIIAVMLFFSVFYQVRSYFIAWPHSSATRQLFQVPPS